MINFCLQQAPPGVVKYRTLIVNLKWMIQVRLNPMKEKSRASSDDFVKDENNTKQEVFSLQFEVDLRIRNKHGSSCLE